MPCHPYEEYAILVIAPLLARIAVLLNVEISWAADPKESNLENTTPTNMASVSQIQSVRQSYWQNYPKDDLRYHCAKTLPCRDTLNVFPLDNAICIKGINGNHINRKSKHDPLGGRFRVRRRSFLTTAKGRVSMGVKPHQPSKSKVKPGVEHWQCLDKGFTSKNAQNSNAVWTENMRSSSSNGA